MVAERSPQIGWRFPLAGLPILQRCRGQDLPNHFKSISVHNHVVVHITRRLSFSMPPANSEFIMCLDDFKP